MALAFLIHWQIYHVFDVPQRLWCCIRDAFVVDLIWCEVLLVLVLLILWWPFPLYSFPIYLQVFPGNFKDIPKACYCSALLFCVITCLIKCRKMSIFLSLLCPRKQISKLSLSDGMKICVAACFLMQGHVLGRKADCLLQCALLPVQTAGSSQREAYTILRCVGGKSWKYWV